MPNKTKVGTITRAQVREIAEKKMPDLNAATLEAADEPGGRYLPVYGRHRCGLNFAAEVIRQICRASKMWEDYSASPL